MTVEEIERILQTVAENQAKLTGHAAQTDERLDRVVERFDQVATLQTKHSSDIVEIDSGIASLLSSQNRYDERLAVVGEIMHTLADKQLKNEELFAELAAARERHELRMGQLEASYELFEGFVRDFRNETHDHFAETDKRLVALAESQAKTDEQMKRTGERVDTLTRDIAALNGRADRTDERLDRIAEHVETHDRQFARIEALQSENAAQIKALAEAQARTDEQIRLLLNRNGSKAKPKPKAGAKKPAAKRSKKGGAK